MKLFLKTVTGNQQETIAEETTTIADIKKKLENDYDLSTLRLCFKGAVLEDAKTVKDLNLSEGDTLVIAGKKKKISKPAAAAAPPMAAPAPGPETQTEVKDAEAPAPSAETEEKTTEEPKEEAKPEAKGPTAETSTSAAAMATAPEAAPAPAPTTVSAPAPATTAEAPAPSIASATPVHADPTHGVDSNLIDNLVAMGFEDRSQVALALRAAYMNPDRAVEYLCTGIPASVLSEFTQPSAPAPPAHAHAHAHTHAPHPAAPATAAVQPVAGATDLRSELWNNIPHFDQIKSVYQENNSTLPVIMSQIAERYPRLYQMIEEKPEEFLTIMAERGQPANAVASPTGSTAAAAAATGSAEQLPESVATQLTAEDGTAIDQLVELGGGMWDRDAATLVYLAVERNQEVAASLLFEHGGIPPELLQQIAAQLQGQGDDEEDPFEEDD